MSESKDALRETQFGGDDGDQQRQTQQLELTPVGEGIRLAGRSGLRCGS